MGALGTRQQVRACAACEMSSNLRTYLAVADVNHGAAQAAQRIEGQHRLVRSIVAVGPEGGTSAHWQRQRMRHRRRRNVRGGPCSSAVQ